MVNVYTLMCAPEVNVYPEPVHIFICREEELEDLLEQYVEDMNLSDKWEDEEMDFNDIPVFSEGYVNRHPENPWDWYFIQCDYTSSVI